MATITTSAAQQRSIEANLLTRKQRSLWQDAWWRLRRNRAAMLGIGIIAVTAILAIFAPMIAPFDPTTQDTKANNMDPFWVSSVYHNSKYLLGSDELGRDILSRLIWSTRISLIVGLVPTAIVFSIGVSLGLVAGYIGGWIDNLLMRITDLVLTLPALAILLTAAALLGQGSQWRVSVILTLFFWTGIARVVRGVFLSLREKEYVEAAKAAGAGDARIMFRHILPNTLGPIIVNGTLAVAAAILTEAALSFLGFGITPPTPSLGNLVQSGQTNPQQWWLTIFPGLTIVLIVLCINFIGDGARDALDPTQRRVRA